MRLKHVETGPLRLIRGQDTSRTPGLLGAERHYRFRQRRPVRKFCSDVIARTRCVKSPNPPSRYLRQIERHEVGFRTKGVLYFSNHSPGEHCSGCVSGGVHDIT
jgi:hypothetical protein